MADQRLQSTRRKFLSRSDQERAFHLARDRRNGRVSRCYINPFRPSNRGSLLNPVDAFGSSGGLRPEQGLAETRLEERSVPRWQHQRVAHGRDLDRKSTRLNSSHLGISYAVFCLQNKKK